jgi:hypothetical protein
MLGLSVYTSKQEPLILTEASDEGIVVPLPREQISYREGLLERAAVYMENRHSRDQSLRPLQYALV